MFSDVCFRFLVLVLIRVVVLVNCSTVIWILLSPRIIVGNLDILAGVGDMLVLFVPAKHFQCIFY